MGEVEAKENQRCFDYKTHLVPLAPSKAFYIPEFITDLEEQILLDNVYKAPKPKWVQLSNRRLQNWGGLPHPKGMVAEAIPPWLKKYLDRLASLDLFDGKSPNHVLVNEYLPGQGIMPHTDGPLFYPTITTINLGSDTVLDFYRNLHSEDDEKSDECSDYNAMSSLSSRYVGSMFLERRSLVCIKEDMYNVYLHGIEESKEDVLSRKTIFNLEEDACNLKGVITRGTRVSLTIRHFPKVLKFKFGRK